MTPDRFLFLAIISTVFVGWLAYQIGRRLAADELYRRQFEKTRERERMKELRIQEGRK